METLMQEMTHRLTKELRKLAFENHERCTSCGYLFNKGDTSHFGYGQSDDPQYVCDKCAVHLKETAIRHQFNPLPYEVPTMETKLWRYMDFTKYMSMLSSAGIYFSRSDCFEDLFEGAKGIKKLKNKYDLKYLEFFKEMIKTPPEGYTCQLSDEEIQQHAQLLLQTLEVVGNEAKTSTFINCWHESPHESEAMWRLYSSFLPNAIAIQTTYKRLYESLGCETDIKIGRIKYIDLNNNYASVNNAFWRKRKSFEHEKEVRALIVNDECKDTGKIIPCEIGILIEAIFISPQAPEWFANLVNDVNEKYSVNIKISRSELLEEPFF